MDRYSHTGLFLKKIFYWFEKFKMGVNVQTILLRSEGKGAEFYLEVNSFLTFVELNYIKVTIPRYICRFMNLE